MTASNSAAQKTLFFSAGELSGDQLGGQLASQLRLHCPTYHLLGMGGKTMQDAGVQLVQDIAETSVNGFFEVIKHLPKLLRIEKILQQAMLNAKPDLVILIDYQGLNLRLARFAKQYGFKTLFYVSPQIWASRYNRIKKIRRYVDHMAVLYQFEKDIYEKEHIPVTFVGHPLKQRVQASRSRADNYTHFKLDPNRPIITLLPGSRPSECQRLLPALIEAKTLLQKQYPAAQFVLLLAPSLNAQAVKQACPEDIHFVTQDTYDLFSITNVAIAVSGTVTLELALMHVPMVIVYKVSTPTYHLLKRLIKTPYIGLCNILLGAPVVKELIQHTANGPMIAKEVNRLLEDTPYRQKMITTLKDTNAHMGSETPSDGIYQCVMRLLST